MQDRFVFNHDLEPCCCKSNRSDGDVIDAGVEGNEVFSLIGGRYARLQFLNEQIRKGNRISMFINNASAETLRKTGAYSKAQYGEPA